jgi:tetratricopeptide (TPR) repeat protein
MNKKLFQRLAIGLFSFAFIGSTAIAVIPGLFEQKTATNSASTETSLENQLQQQVRGYEKVLEREPKNPTASQELFNIANTYLRSGDLAKAIPILEKLVEYNPEQTELKSYLKSAKQELLTEQKAKTESQTKPEK